jgi:hypothetical protein
MTRLALLTVVALVLTALPSHADALPPPGGASPDMPVAPRPLAARPEPPLWMCRHLPGMHIEATYKPSAYTYEALWNNVDLRCVADHRRQRQ